MFRKLILITFLSFCSVMVSAQFRIANCVDKQFKNETCLIKNIDSSEKFTLNDVLAMKKFVQENPQLPWLDIIDHDRSLAAGLRSAGLPKSASKEDTGHFILGLMGLESKKDPDPLVFLDLSALFLKYNPNENLHFNNKDKTKFAAFEGVLYGDLKPKGTGIHKYCDSFSQKRFEQVMEQKNQCMTHVEASSNADMVYKVLAQVIACEKYCISEVGVKEEGRLRSIVAANCNVKTPCVIQFEKNESAADSPTEGKISANIGYGKLKYKMSGKYVEASWTSNYDLAGKKNTEESWSEQIFPQIEELNFGKETSPPGDGATDSTRTKQTR